MKKHSLVCYLMRYFKKICYLFIYVLNKLYTIQVLLNDKSKHMLLIEFIYASFFIPLNMNFSPYIYQSTSLEVYCLIDVCQPSQLSPELSFGFEHQWLPSFVPLPFVSELPHS